MSESQPSMEDLRNVMREELRPLWKRIERHDREIYGHNGTPGLTTRVQNNEQHANRVTWYVRAMFGAIATVVVGWFTMK